MKNLKTKDVLESEADFDEDYYQDYNDDYYDTSDNNTPFVDDTEPEREGKPIVMQQAEPITDEEDVADDVNSDCRTGSDLIEACKNLSETIVTLQQPTR